MCIVKVPAETNRSGAVVARAIDASPGLGWLLRAFCYCCSSGMSRGITIAIGPQPHAGASTLGLVTSAGPATATAGAGLYACVVVPYADAFVVGCPTLWYAGVAPSHVPSQPPLCAEGSPRPLQLGVAMMRYPSSLVTMLPSV